MRSWAVRVVAPCKCADCGRVATWGLSICPSCYADKYIADDPASVEWAERENRRNGLRPITGGPPNITALAEVARVNALYDIGFAGPGTYDGPGLYPPRDYLDAIDRIEGAWKAECDAGAWLEGCRYDGDLLLPSFGNADAKWAHDKAWFAAFGTDDPMVLFRSQEFHDGKKKEASDGAN